MCLIRLAGLETEFSDCSFQNIILLFIDGRFQRIDSEARMAYSYQTIISKKCYMFFFLSGDVFPDRK